MKILFVTPIFTGITKVIINGEKAIGMPAVYKLHDALIKKGHKVTVIGPLLNSTDGLYHKVDFNRIIERSGITYRILRPEGAFIAFAKESFVVKKLNKFLSIVYWYFKIKETFKQENPEIVYTAFLGMVTNYLAKKHDVPSILRFYGTFLGSTRLPGNIHHWTYKFRNIEAWLSFKSHYKYLIMTNDGTKGDAVARAFRVPKDKIKFWINGVEKDYRMLSPKEKSALKANLGLKDDTKIVLAVSRLEGWKRVDRLVRAASQIKDFSSNVTFLVVGDGPEKENLQRLIEDLRIEEIVKLVGFVPHELINSYLQIADIFVSLYDISNLCNPVLEAMSSGKCVVTLNDGSLYGIMQNGENGVLIDPKTTDEKLAKTIVDLLQNENLRFRLGKQARIFAEESLETWEERIDKEIDLLGSLIKSK